MLSGCNELLLEMNISLRIKSDELSICLIELNRLEEATPNTVKYENTLETLQHNRFQVEYTTHMCTH